MLLRAVGMLILSIETCWMLEAFIKAIGIVRQFAPDHWFYSLNRIQRGFFGIALTGAVFSAIAFRDVKLVWSKLRPGAGTAMIFTLILLGFTSPLWGQGGAVGFQTVNIQVFNARTAAATSAVVPNVGQAAHELLFCIQNPVTTFAIILEGSFDNSNWVQISPVGSSSSLGSTTFSGCGFVEAGGYYPNVRARITSFIGGGGSISAWYSGSAGPIATRAVGVLDSQVHGNVDVLSLISQAQLTSTPALVAQASATNPGNSQMLLAVRSNNGGPNVIYRHTVVSCSVACQIDVDEIQNNENTCSAVTIINMNFSFLNFTGSKAMTGPCTGNPTSTLLSTYFLAANQTIDIPLDGFFNPPGSAFGVGLFVHSSITGTAAASMYWYER